jgi:hypothetical protein
MTLTLFDRFGWRKWLLQKVDGCEEENAMKLFDPSLRFHMGIAATNQCTKFQTLSNLLWRLGNLTPKKEQR